MNTPKYNWVNFFVSAISDKPLGVFNSSVVKSHMMSSSSDYHESRRAWFGRLDGNAVWCAKHQDKAQYLQVRVFLYRVGLPCPQSKLLALDSFSAISKTRTLWLLALSLFHKSLKSLSFCFCRIVKYKNIDISDIWNYYGTLQSIFNKVRVVRAFIFHQ